MRHPYLLHHLIETPEDGSQKIAVEYERNSYSYEELKNRIDVMAMNFHAKGIQPGDRVALYLTKNIDFVIAVFAVSALGAVFVPINPILKKDQVLHILEDSESKLLLTSKDRLTLLDIGLLKINTLETIITAESNISVFESPKGVGNSYQGVETSTSYPDRTGLCETDLAALLYTSGSTGYPKGVMLSHANLIKGAQSVSAYLKLMPSDRILATLPFSFDAGLSQLTTAFLVNATVVLHNYFNGRELAKVINTKRITCLTAVPTILNDFSKTAYESDSKTSLRLVANTGGALHPTVVNDLRKMLPNCDIFLMYGLTEAFRSTYLDPKQVDLRPTSIGKAIPNADVLVLRTDGTQCEPHEIGELVHRGPLVAKGYWKQQAETEQRFKTLAINGSLEPVVFSGDLVKRDDEGFLYFVGRNDMQIKVSGYRISPEEIEGHIMKIDVVNEVSAIGVVNSSQEQVLAVYVHSSGDKTGISEIVRSHCSKHLPPFMIPKMIIVSDKKLPRNPNGKIDKTSLKNGWHTESALDLT